MELEFEMFVSFPTWVLRTYAVVLGEYHMP